MVVLVASLSDYSKQGQFRTLNEFGRSLNESKVIREGSSTQIATAELLVGDVYIIQTGDVLPADGVFFRGFELEIDER